MANTILTPSVITKEALMILHQKLNFVTNINTQYDSQYATKGAKIGNDLKIRQPNEFTIRSGASLSTQDVAEASTTLKVDTQKGVDFVFDSEELTMHIDEFSSRYLEPAMAVLAANMENDALTMVKDVYNFHDGVSSANTYNNVVDAGSILTNNLTPYESRCFLHDPTGLADVIKDTKGLFNDSKSISKSYKDGGLARTAGFDHYENTLVPSHTTGTAAEGATSYLINGAAQTGADMTVDGGTTTFLVGDIVTIVGVNRCHPETKADTGDLQQFVVTANSGSSATSLSLSPSIVTTGGRQNVVAGPADNAAIHKVGGGNAATWKQSIAFHKDAFAFATADLVKPNGVDFCAREVMDGISMRIIRDYTISDDKFPCRIDVLYGYKTLRAQNAVRIGHNS